MTSRAHLLLIVVVASSPAVAQEDHRPLLDEAAAALASYRLAESPTLDGDPGDAVWNAARELVMEANKVWPQPEPRSTPVLLKSVHTESHIYFLVRWKDETRDDGAHKPWVWNVEKGAYEEGPEREDMLSLAFEHTGRFVTDMLAGEPAVWDVWHWKATRTNPQGYAMDKTHRYTAEQPEGKAKSYTSRDGRTIWIARPEDAGDSLERKQPAPQEYQDDRVSQYLQGEPTGSAADVRAKGDWADGWWTLELARPLDTGHADDTVFDAGRACRMAISVHDRTGEMDKATGKIELSFAPALPIDSERE